MNTGAHEEGDPARAPKGLVHLGLAYTTPEDLVDAVLPRIQVAVRCREAVVAVVDPVVQHRLCRALGAAGRTIDFTVLSASRTPDAEDALRRLRALSSTDRRGLVLLQHSAAPTPARELELREDGVNLVLGDLPLTLVCAVERDTPGRLLDALGDRHPYLVDPDEANPRYRTPLDRCATLGATWGGTHVLRVRFSHTGDLRTIRDHVRALAVDVGLSGDDVHAAAFGVHEAVLLACDTRARAAAAEACVLDLWTAPMRLLAEVRGPCPEAQRSEDGDGPRVPRVPGQAVDPIRYVRLFCREAVTYESAGHRTTRIVVAHDRAV